MPSWLKSVLNFFGGGLSAIWKAVVNLVNTTYQVLTGQIGDVRSYAESVAVSEHNLAETFTDFVSDFYAPFVQHTDGTFNDVGKRIDNNFNTLNAKIDALQKEHDTSITVVEQQESADYAALIKWVLSTVFGPLSSEIAQALAWIAKEGAYVYDLLTDLSKLADLVIAFLWTGWIALFQKYAKQVVIVILSDWKSWIPDLMPVIEDILSSLF